MRFLLGNSTPGVSASDDNTSWVGDDKKGKDKYHSDIPDGERYAETCVLSLMALTGTIGNALVCLTIITQKPLRQHSFHKVKLVSLSLSDLLVCAFIMPQTAFTVFRSRWEFSEQLCTLTGFANMVALVCSVMSLGLISLNRYMKICHTRVHPHIYTNRNIALMALGVWCLSAMLATPPLVGWAEYDYLPRQSFCFCKWTTSVSYSFFMVIVCFGGPFGMMILCYVPIFKSFKKVRQRLKQNQEKKGVTKQKGHGPFRVQVKEGDDKTKGASLSSSKYSEPTSSALDMQQTGSSVTNTALSRTPAMTKEAIVPIGPAQNSAPSAGRHVPTSPKQVTSVAASTSQQKNETPTQSKVRVSSEQEGTAGRVCMLEKQAISTGPSTKAGVHEGHTAYVGSAVQEELPLLCMHFANPATESGAVAHGQCHAYSLGGMERFGTDVSGSPVDLNRSTMLQSGGNEGLQTTVSDTPCVNSDKEAALPAPSTELTPGNKANVGLVPLSLSQHALNAHTDSGEGMKLARHNCHVQAVASEKKPLDAKAGTSESCLLALHSGDGPTEVPIRPKAFKITRKTIYRLGKRLRWKHDPGDVQLAKTLMVVIVAFVLCWMPYCITMFLSVFAPHTITRTPAMFTLMLGYSNSCLNPILYSLTDSGMKKGYRNLLTRRRTALIAPTEAAGDGSAKDYKRLDSLNHFFDDGERCDMFSSF